jgi:hypothetical protein
MSFDNSDKIPRKPEEHPGKTRNQGTVENSHIGHCTQYFGKYKMLMGNNIKCAKNWNYRITGTFCTLETWCVSGV